MKQKLETLEKRIESFLEIEHFREMILTDDLAFDEMIRILKQKRSERLGVAYCPDNPADQDTPEG